MNLAGELSMLFGVLAIWCLSITAISSLPQMYDAIGEDRWLRGQRMGYLALALVAFHLLVMGWSGWLKPEEWPGGMPPISMVAFLVAIAPPTVKAVWIKRV